MDVVVREKCCKLVSNNSQKTEIRSGINKFDIVYICIRFIYRSCSLPSEGIKLLPYFNETFCFACIRNSRGFHTTSLPSRLQPPTSDIFGRHRWLNAVLIKRAASNASCVCDQPGSLAMLWICPNLDLQFRYYARNPLSCNYVLTVASLKIMFMRIGAPLRRPVNTFVIVGTFNFRNWMSGLKHPEH